METNPARPGDDSGAARTVEGQRSGLADAGREGVVQGDAPPPDSVRQLQWSDVSLTVLTVHWRGEFDKTGKESVTARAVLVLRAVPRVLGSPWVFPTQRTRHGRCRARR